jgi:hypothetical protein
MRNVKAAILQLCMPGYLRCTNCNARFAAAERQVCLTLTTLLQLPVDPQIPLQAQERAVACCLSI